MLRQMILGIISDTHGVLRQNALDALRGVDHVIHAGDIGNPEVIAALEQVAPTTAVRGNTDREPWAESLASEEILTLADTTFFILHDLHDLSLDPAAAGIQVVISGHTHQPMVQTLKDILYFNPGSASQRRRGGPLAVGHIRIAAHGIFPEIIQLDR
jgi:putative phosphoesterase